MYTYNDLHLMREFAILLVLGLFVLVAVLAGMLDSRRKARRHAAVLTGHGATASTKTRATGRDHGGCVAQQQAWVEGQPVAMQTRRAA